MTAGLQTIHSDNDRMQILSPLGPRRPIFGSAVLLMMLSPSLAQAFHEQGTGDCESCHVAHNSQDGFPIVPGGGFDTPLLRAESATDLCLSCHADDLGSALSGPGQDPLNPASERGAGNFVFLFEDNLNDGPDGRLNPISGDAAGHNVVAIGYGLVADSRHTVAPGGTFQSSELGCTSCHDPHGNENFRLLYGVGDVQGGLARFTYPAPEADGIPLAGAPESQTHHVAYKRGWSDWCANCHGQYHDNGLGAFDHDVKRGLGRRISGRYNEYDGDANPVGGVAATAYLAEVPFEDPAATISSNAGPTGGSWIMCLTCHRAHASSSPSAGRWDFRVGLLIQDGQVSGSFRIPSPYLDPDQGSLCAKCHADFGQDAEQGPSQPF